VKQAIDTADPVLNVAGIEDLLAGPTAAKLEERLIAYLPHQRWFGAKSRTLKNISVLDSAKLPGLDAALVFLQLIYDDNGTDVYQLPLAIAGGLHAQNARAVDSSTIISSVSTPAGPAILHDAVAEEAVRQAILNLIETNGQLRTRGGFVRGQRSTAFSAARGEGPLPARTGSAEQSNTSILYGRKLILKLFRRLQPGENPDTEIGRFLTETAHFEQIAPFLGDITLESKNSEPVTLAMLQGLIEHEGDGWEWTLNELSRYYRCVESLAPPQSLGAYASFRSDEEPPAAPAREHAGDYLEATALLGRRTAEMHLALATPTDNPAFRAEAFTREALSADLNRIEVQLLVSLEALARGLPGFTGTTAHNAEIVLRRRDELLSRARGIASAGAVDFGQRIRIHGDYHLGQVLRSHGDYTILDFEGEPAKPVAQRRSKQCPLKDVAGMLRSFGYAAYAGLYALGQLPPDQSRSLEAWADLWQNAVSTEYLRAYRSTIASAPHLIPPAKEAQMLLNAYLLEKALYELLYELNNRHAWVRIPLAGILTLQ
jgi:maltose alpha-D-glucosyltransferase / alpha-amylase